MVPLTQDENLDAIREGLITANGLLERIAVNIERTNQLLATKDAQPGTKFAEQFTRLAWDVFKNPVVIRQAAKA